MRLRFVLVLAWATIIFIASSFPNPPGASGNEWRYNLAHMVEYAILGALTVLALRAYRPNSRRFVIPAAAFTFAILYGMSDEFHQSFVPNRDANWLDVGFDALGAALGTGAVSLIRGIRAGRSIVQD